MAEIGQMIGVQFYLELKIKDNKINPLNIQYLVIREWIFNILPTVEIRLIDDGYFTEIIPLEDSEDIQIILGKHEDDENPIELIFSLNDYTSDIISDNRKSILTITGTLKANDMFWIRSRSFPKQNSITVLSTIAEESKITFSNPHNIIPSDNMTWIQNDLSNFKFIKHVLKRAYIPDDVLFFYANSLNKFIVTSLKSEMDRTDIKKSKFDIIKFGNNAKDNKDPDDTIWFASYNIVNYSNFFNENIGYGFKYSYYDLENNNLKTYSNINKITQLSFRNKDFVGKPVIKNLNNELIESNIYGSEYFESLLRNQFLKNNFFANSIVLNVNALSKINLMDKIDLSIPSLFKSEQSNEVMSGFYLVMGIQHEITKGGIYKKKIALGRNGMNKSSNIKIYKVEE